MELKCAVHVDAGMINAAISTLHIIGGKPLSLIIIIFCSTIIIVLGIFIHYQKFQFGGKGCGSFTCCPPTLIIFLYTTAKTKENIPLFFIAWWEERGLPYRMEPCMIIQYINSYSCISFVTQVICYELFQFLWHRTYYNNTRYISRSYTCNNYCNLIG